MFAQKATQRRYATEQNGIKATDLCRKAKDKKGDEKHECQGHTEAPPIWLIIGFSERLQGNLYN